MLQPCYSKRRSVYCANYNAGHKCYRELLFILFERSWLDEHFAVKNKNLYFSKLYFKKVQNSTSIMCLIFDEKRL
jgi:hypothetical protein